MTATADAVHYPWEAVDHLTRASVERARTTRQRLARAVRGEPLARALGEVLGTDVAVVVHRVEARSSPRALPEARAELECDAGATRIVVAVEPALATAALSRALGRPVGLDDPHGALDPALEGALGALLLEVARRSGSTEPLRASPPEALGEGGLSVEATVVLDGRPYRASAWLRAAALPTGQLPIPADLAALGSMPIALPLVVAVSLATRAELRQLEVGDAWLFGDAAKFGREGLGQAALCAPLGERGVAVDLRSGGDLLVRGEAVHLGTDVAMNDETVENAVLDAPIVIRIELGAVSLSAREWAELAPGDVILAARRISEPAVLRVGGHEVARGELVDVDGELGVRIQHLAAKGTKA
jgi:flagellar motor switch/type III secretory pathway protein FliN